ncbi:hypothetical protein EJ04DRAFT_529126 [Polyplosphaeria fusca]|uniref:Uncharacterized protein n=1 Tax=Polyplosphaeria fusca TaxID=682080 RepID=A0A9P4UX37_9PLEO|nr:hypothetical protein EJ04DRAFT_529126 [Polyplosphaeria fusca]
MRGTLSLSLSAKAWQSPGNGALFSKIQSATPLGSRSLSLRPLQPTVLAPPRPNGLQRALLPPPASVPRSLRTALPPFRLFSVSRGVLEANKHGKTTAKVRKSYREEMKERGTVDAEEQEGEVDEEQGFAKSEKAAAASKVNLSAKLSKEGAPGAQQGSMKEIWRLLKIARPELRTLSFAFVFLLVSSAVSMSIPFSIGRILDIATQSKESGDMLFGLDMTTFYIALAAILTTGAAANFGRIILLRIVGERIVARLRSQLYRKTFIQNAEFFDANRVGDLISRLGSDTIIVGKSITQNVSDGLRSIVSGCAGFAMMAWVSLKLTGILALVGPPVAIVAFVSGRALRNISRKIQKNLGTLTKIAEERLGNVRTSQAFAGEIQEAGRYNRQVKRIFALGKREAIVAASFYGSTGLMGNLTVIAVLYIGGSMVKSGAITIGELSSFLMYTAYAGGSMVGLSGFWGEMMKGVGAASRLFELQDRNPTISPTVGEPVKSARGLIEFKHVSFSYPTRPAVYIFKDLNFRIEQGSNVAIVAPSGAGKSTVASLLLRFYIPTQGEITINGRDITKLNAKQLRRKIGYVGQEPVLFSGTIAENIAYGVPNATRAEIVAAARKANCQFISDFPDGLETHVGARGTQLSGGQKQRIAIARALIKEPDILILDEATSALDAESETLVNQALGKLLQEKNTTISIAHRLSTIKRSDRIIVLTSDGKVAEEGTYKELSSNSEGAFSKLMEWQLNGGEVDTVRKPPQPTEIEEIERELEEDDEDDEAAAAADKGRAAETVETPSTPSTSSRRYRFCFGLFASETEASTNKPHLDCTRFTHTCSNFSPIRYVGSTSNHTMRSSPQHATACHRNQSDAIPARPALLTSRTPSRPNARITKLQPEAMGSQSNVAGQGKAHGDNIDDAVITQPIKEELCDHSPMLKTAQFTSYRLAHRSPAYFRPTLLNLSQTRSIPDPHDHSSGRDMHSTHNCCVKSKSRFQKDIEDRDPVELTERYKMAGNREDRAPKHETVMFEGLLSSKRAFGEFRTVLHTGLYSQVVAMEVPVNGEIGDEVHTVDQILLFTSGEGQATVAGKNHSVKAGDVVVVPAGTQHQFVAKGDGDQPLELVTIYSPAEHNVKTVHKNKAQGDEEEETGIDEAPKWSQKSKKENEAAGLVN